MKRRDITAFNAGLLFLGLSGLALWLALGTVNWKAVSIAAPLALVAIGVAGLLLAQRPRP